MLQAASVASASGFARLQQDVARAAGESGRLRRSLDAQRAAFAALWDSAKVRHSLALLRLVVVGQCCTLHCRAVVLLLSAHLYQKQICLEQF